MIKLQSYPVINKLTITNELLVLYINNFWSDIFTDIKDTNYLLLMCKVHFADDVMGYRTLGHLVKVNFDDKELYIDYLSKRLSILSDSYITHPISNITFSYIIKSGQCNDNDRALLQDLSDRSVGTHNFNNMLLPASMEPSAYGDVRLDQYVQVEGKSVHRFMVINSNKTYEIDVSQDEMSNKVTILGNYNLSWIDTKISEMTGTDIFKREIRKSTIYFMGGEIVLRKQELNAKPFIKIKSD